MPATSHIFILRPFESAVDGSNRDNSLREKRLNEENFSFKNTRQEILQGMKETERP